jgi:nitrate reductase gamma subunit
MKAMTAMTATAVISAIQIAICVALGVLIIWGVVLYIKREIADHRARKRAISSINEINEALKQITWIR